MKKPGLRLYTDRLSQPCRAVEIFMKANRIPFVEEEINIALGEHRTDEFKQINRFQKVPVLSDIGFTLAESVAIMRYLCRTASVAEHWYPKGPKRRARVDEFLEWQHIELRSCCALWVRQMYFAKIMGREDPPDLVKFYRRRMVGACNAIENLWLSHKKKFLIGNKITIADLLAVCELEELKLTGYDPTEGRPLLAGWMVRVRAATNPYYDAAHEKLNSLAKINKPEDALTFLTSKL